MIPENKKRVQLTLHKDTLKIAEGLKPLLKAKTTSEVVEMAVISFGDAIFQHMNKKLNKGEDHHEEN